MKRRYVIGLFVIMLLAALLDIGFYTSYHLSRLESVPESVSEPEAEPILPADGTAEKNTGYYLAAQSGYVIVYLGDRQTIFQYTSILLDDLPDEIQSEIEEMKYMRSTKELYSFLENYSS